MLGRAPPDGALIRTRAAQSTSSDASDRTPAPTQPAGTPRRNPARCEGGRLLGERERGAGNRSQWHTTIVVVRRQPTDTPRATSPMTAANSFGRDHIGQWLVGRST